MEILWYVNHKTPLNQSTGLIVLIVLHRLRTSLFMRSEGRVSSFRSLAHLLRLPDKEVFTRVSLIATVNMLIRFFPFQAHVLHSNGLTKIMWEGQKKTTTKL